MRQGKVRDEPAPVAAHVEGLAAATEKEEGFQAYNIYWD